MFRNLQFTVIWIGIFMAYSLMPALAQEEKFGKIDEATLKMTSYDKDPQTEAVVLFNVGESRLEFNVAKGFFELIYERHCRIKIFNKNGYRHADHSIVYYKPSGTSKEYISGLKGYTYLLEEGKVVKHKLENSSIFEEEYTDELFIKKFTMPNVKEGCVIEYSYKITTDFFTYLKSWEFQDDIPVMYSQYTTEIPEPFNYKLSMQGYTDVTPSKKQDLKTGSLGAGSTRTFTINVNTYTAKDIPAFRNEKFITAEENYILRIDYQLASFDWPGEMTQDILPSWNKILKGLMESANYGKKLKARGELKDVAESISKQYTQPEEKMKAIYEYVKKTVKWNDKYTYLAQTPFRKVLESQKGSVAEINLMLTSLLREADLNANPVILSTRKNGILNPYVPMIRNFNYVITQVQIGEKRYLLDASQPYLSAGIIPFHCLNGQGVVTYDEKFEWIDLSLGRGKISQNTTVMLKMDESGVINGTLNIHYQDYAAENVREAIAAESEEKYWEKNWKSESNGFKLQSNQVENLQDYSKPLKLNMKIEMENEAMGSKIYLDPFLQKSFNENPFKQEERSFPVDFGCPIVESYFMSFTLPEGFEVEEMPKSGVMVLPDKSASFSYTIGQQQNMIQIRSRLSIEKGVYLPDEYKSLKEFFAQVISKQKEQIILKKKS
jgi:Domain of Unknown Function with PDB structure (DUF3857)/Transglutaminase-like superfamily